MVQLVILQDNFITLLTVAKASLKSEELGQEGGWVGVFEAVYPFQEWTSIGAKFPQNKNIPAGLDEE